MIQNNLDHIFACKLEGVLKVDIRHQNQITNDSIHYFSRNNKKRRVLKIGGNMKNNKFEFPNDSPKQELIYWLTKSGLSLQEAEVLLTCFLIERIESNLVDFYHLSNLN